MTIEERKRRDGAILFGHINGDSMKTLVSKHELTRQRIYIILNSQGVKLKQDLAERDSCIIGLHQERKSKKEIAEELEITKDVVRGVLRKNDCRWIAEKLSCEICDTLFIQHTRGHRLCSDECRAEDKRRYSKHRREADIGIWKKCELCGKQYKVYRAEIYSQRFCSQSCGGRYPHRKKEMRNKLIFEYRHVDNLTFKRIGEIFNLSKSAAYAVYRKQLQIRNERLAELTGV